MVGKGGGQRVLVWRGRDIVGIYSFCVTDDNYCSKIDTHTREGEKDQDVDKKQDKNKIISDE